MPARETGPVPGGLRIAWMRPSVAVTCCRAGASVGAAGAASFTVILVAEFGDLTQVVTAGLAARDHAPVLVGAAAMLALWTVAGLAIAGGRGLLKVLPLVWITRLAAVVMLVLAAVSAAAAFT
jgi:Ca2+/H+ antiporter, TMEM165/GDT1 family